MINIIINNAIIANRKKRYKKSKKEKILNLFIGIFGGIVAAGCLSIGGYFYFLSNDSGEFDKLMKAAYHGEIAVFPNSLEDQPSAFADIEERQPVNLSQLQQENNDLAGWIAIPGTQIDYPVMHTPKDGEYYLHRNFSKKYSLSGVPFIDAACSIGLKSENIIVYGHNMKNGSMFSELLSYMDREFWEEHKKVILYTLETAEEYEVIAAFPVDVLRDGEIEDYFSVDFMSEEEFSKYSKKIKEKSMYDTGTDIEYGDELLTLSTCSYHTEDGRFLVISRKK